MGYIVAIVKKNESGRKRKPTETGKRNRKSSRAFGPGLGLGWKDQASFLHIKLKEVSKT